MKLQLVFLAIFGRSVIHSAHSVVNGNCPCTTPQYLEYGKKGTITCNFTSAIDVIHWYDTNDTLHNPPVISWNKKSEDGIGFSTGGYEIQPNGSLLIKDTISEGDLYFSVVMLFNELIACAQTIHVIGFVYPHQNSYLAIDKCDGKRFCHRRVDSGRPLQLSCHLNGSVVSKPILWEMWTSGEPRPLRPAGKTFSAESVGEETNMSLQLPFTGQRLDVLVCKIEDNFAHKVKSSTILVEWTNNNSNTQYETITPINKMAELKSTVRLDCGRSKRISFFWKMCHSENKYDCVEIMHFALENKIFWEKGFSADNSGTLFVEEVNTRHEGWFWCYSSDGRSNTERFYRLDVYAIPVPVNPIVAECGDKYFCQIESGLKGNITCSLFGVRPEASLEWVVISLTSSKIISLEKKEQTVISFEGVYDISIKTLYHVESLQFSKIDLECRANVNITSMPSLSTRVQLCLSDLNTSGVENHQNPSRVWILTLLLPLVFATCAVIIYKKQSMASLSLLISNRQKSTHGVHKIGNFDFYNRRRDETNQIDEGEPLNKRKREQLKEDFRISLSTLKVNIARNLRIEDAQCLSSMFQLGEEEQNAVLSSKNPAVALIDVFLDGDEMTVKYNLCELERISKICDMVEVNHLLNSFIRSRFRESFLLKVNIMKNGELAKEEERLLHKLLWDYSEIKTISELEAFFEENYNTTISSVQEGSLDLWLKLPPTELLDKLWTDIQSGILATKIYLIIIKDMELEYSYGNTFELKVSCDTNVGKRIKELITKRDHAAKGKRNNVNNQYKSDTNRSGKDAASESHKTVLAEMVATMSFQIANFIGSVEASYLCKRFKLSQERSERILLSPNPGLEVIISLIKEDQKSLERIIDELNVAALELSWQEVNYILQHFKRNICKNQADNLENKFFSEDDPTFITIKAMIHIWLLFFKPLISTLSKFIGREGSSALSPTKDEKTIPVSKGSVQEKEMETHKNEERDASDLNLQAIRRIFFDIASEMKIVECQRSFSDYDVFLLNLAVKHINEWKENCDVVVNQTRWKRIAVVITIVWGLLLTPFLWGSGFYVIWTSFSVFFAILYLPFVARSVHIEGIEVMQMDVSPMLTKLLTITRTVDQIAIIFVKASLINDKLQTLSQFHTTEQLSHTRRLLEGHLQLCKQQKCRHYTSLVENVQESFQIMMATYDAIQNFYETVNDDQTKISSKSLNLNDAIKYIIDNAIVFHPSWLHSLLIFYGIVDVSHCKLDRSTKDNFIREVVQRWKRTSSSHNLSLKSRTTSMVANAISEASLQDKPSTEILSNVVRNGVLLKESGIFINFGDIGREVVASCKDVSVEPSFVFEHLQHQMMVLREVCMSVHSL